MLKKTPRKVKIVCTLGPASSSPERITQLIEAGMDIARLNFSHGSHEFHAGLIETIRTCATKTGKTVAIMQDLQGPKIRLGKLPATGIELQAGQKYCLHPEGAQPVSLQPGESPLPIMAEIAAAVAADVRPGARILFDDGKVATRTLHVEGPEIHVQVEVGGKLTSHKGMNLPGTPLSIPCLTEKDREDMKFGVSKQVDAIALSFVRSAEDILNLKDEIAALTSEPPMVVAKIEREEAIEEMDSIIEVSDALLVARGDMAVEIGAWRVPGVQKQLIKSCNELGVPIITATQMLESMIQCPTPTRAEASDVANAVFDGTDCVMLSGETASGQYPIETVEVMSRIIEDAEQNKGFYTSREILPLSGSIVESIEFSASRIANHVGAVAIACLTHSGIAARALAKYRPYTPIVAIMDNERQLRRLAFVWGVRGVIIPKIVATDDLFAMVDNTLLGHQLAQNDDFVVVTAGIPTLRRGTTNMIKVHKIGAQSERAPKKA
ncbi:MAG: pyruvate kinase [Pseudomonadota bacterium]|jgi:pyruvate kinase